MPSVFLSLQRRHFEQVRQATRIIFKVLKGVSSELEDEAELQKMFDRAVGIADSIHAVCMKLVSDSLTLAYSCFRDIRGILCILLDPDDLFVSCNRKAEYMKSFLLFLVFMC